MTTNKNNKALLEYFALGSITKEQVVDLYEGTPTKEDWDYADNYYKKYELWLLSRHAS